MVLSPNNGYTATPHQRQNRRRERPGSRARRSITRKSSIQREFDEGILDAFDLDVPLPTDRTKPSPLLRQNFDQVWQKWKAREAEEKAAAELDKVERELDVEREKLRMFGGEVDDDELYRMGILYDDDALTARNSSTSVSSVVLPLANHSSYVVRHVKPRRSRRRTQWRSLDLYLSLSNLRDDTEIARFLSPSITGQQSAIWHSVSKADSLSQTPPVSADDIDSSPLSLPTSSSSASSSHTSSFITSLPSRTQEDWTFVTNPSHYTHPSIAISPSSEPETWILLGDDL